LAKRLGDGASGGVVRVAGVFPSAVRVHRDGLGAGWVTAVLGKLLGAQRASGLVGVRWRIGIEERAGERQTLIGWIELAFWLRDGATGSPIRVAGLLVIGVKEDGGREGANGIAAVDGKLLSAQRAGRLIAVSWQVGIKKGSGERQPLIGRMQGARCLGDHASLRPVAVLTLIAVAIGERGDGQRADGVAAVISELMRTRQAGRLVALRGCIRVDENARERLALVGRVQFTYRLGNDALGLGGITEVRAVAIAVRIDRGGHRPQWVAAVLGILGWALRTDPDVAIGWFVGITECTREWAAVVGRVGDADGLDDRA